VPQLFARRAEVLLHLKHPSAALEDANAALSANPDSARALKAKGLAHRYRGEWADAAKALGEAQAIDFDDSVVAVQKLCVDKAAILQKRRVIEQNAAAAVSQTLRMRTLSHVRCLQASRREAAAAEARARAPPPPPPPSGGGVVRRVKTEEEYTALLGESRPVVMDWTAAWCGPCRTIAPLVEELAKKHSGVSFVKVDVDEAQFLAQKHGITSMPTFMRFSRRGVKVAEFKGADPAALRRMAEDAAKE